MSFSNPSRAPHFISVKKKSPLREAFYILTTVEGVCSLSPFLPSLSLPSSSLSLSFSYDLYREFAQKRTSLLSFPLPFIRGQSPFSLLSLFLSSIKLGSTLYILSLSLALVFFLFINAAVTSLLSFSSVLFALVPSFPARAYEDFFAHTREVFCVCLSRGWQRGGTGVAAGIYV